ncbi:MAG: hypothetical protein HY000_16720 [Planctomycetes bacterium]|nr:hypothetical protein [Planctomycetota bacterium]
MVTDTGGNLRRVRDLLVVERGEAAQRPTAVHPLKYTNAVEVAKALNDLLLGRRQSREPSPTAPPRPEQPDRPSVVVGEITTNSILATGTPEELEEIRRIVVQVDAAPRQVVIQALLVEVDLGRADELGVELGLQDSVLFDRSVVDKLVTINKTTTSPNGVQTTNQQIISQTSDPGFNFNNRPLGNNTAVHPSSVGAQGLSNLAVGRINGELGFGGLVLAAGSNDVSVLIRALAARRKIDILSRPTITALDNRTAQIQIGQQVPVVEGVSVTAVGGANPVIRQDQAGIILKVIPRITPNDAVVIEVSAEKSQFPGKGVAIFTDATTGRVVEAPIKDQTKASTAVSVKSGQTIVLGGMITKAKSTTERKVPCLGDIPLLGRLFRYDSEQDQRKELLIFLTPRVLQSDVDAESIKEQEIGRVHFPLEDAEQMHGPIFNPSSQADSQGGNSHTGSVTDEAQKPKVRQSSSVNPAARGDSGQSPAGSTRRSRWFKR